MPLANNTGVIVVVLEKFWSGKSIGGDERFGESPKYAAFQGAAPIVAAGDNTVAGGSADRGRSVRIGEPHAFPRQAVAVRCGCPAVRMRQVPIPKVISENENNIRLVGGVRGDK